MKRNVIRGVAGALAVVVTLGGLKAIGALAQVDNHARQIFTLPAVEVIAEKPANDQRAATRPTRDASRI